MSNENGGAQVSSSEQMVEEWGRGLRQYTPPSIAALEAENERLQRQIEQDKADEEARRRELGIVN